MSEKDPLWIKKWTLYLGIPAAVVSILTAIQIFMPKGNPPEHETPPPPAPQVVSASDLVISSADLHVWKEREYLFRIVPGRRVFWYAFDTFLQNPQQKQFQQCRLEYEYATPSGGNGRGTAFAGLWNEYWFDSKPTPFFFNLPGSKDYRQQFFFEGPEQKPQWIRARAICDQPSQQVSPQYYVDLSRAVGF
jgi:hypothetical protein